MELERNSGILLHISSLPSAFGIGDMGPAAYEFVDFLEASGHRYWQLLPLNPTAEEYGHSPYSTYSAFAGNALLISPELLEKKALIDLEEWSVPPRTSKQKVNFRIVEEYKNKMLQAAFLKFREKGKDKEYHEFCRKHSFWLEDHCLYQALVKSHGKEWFSWPVELRDRNPEALREKMTELAEEVQKEKFCQYLFFSQWESLKNYAHKKRVQFIGDIPFYINHKSVDCWAHPECFKLDSRKLPTKISGVPPDLFSEDGQLWGTPVYDWKQLERTEFQWWVDRLRQNLLLFDVVRLDHFRGFSAYWEVPAKQSTARKGKWIKTPGPALFKKVQQVFPEMPFIAEDLGSLDQPVYDLVEEFNFPGMKVLQFAFGEEMSGNPYIPYNHVSNSVVYTGTHDNNTSRGWFQNLGKTERKNLGDYSLQKVSSANVHTVLHRMALNSVARLAVIPMQDILGLGSKAIMNVPGTTIGNWSWRLGSEQIPWEKSLELKQLNSLFGRIKS